MKDLIKIALVLTFMFSATKYLPEIIYQIRLAQLKIIQESKASRWPAIKINF